MGLHLTDRLREQGSLERAKLRTRDRVGGDARWIIIGRAGNQAEIERIDSSFPVADTSIKFYEEATQCRRRTRLENKFWKQL